MSHIQSDGTDKQGADIIPFPTSCREYLGREWGYCTARAVEEIGDRGFCAYHHAERTGYYARPVAGRA